MCFDLFPVYKAVKGIKSIETFEEWKDFGFYCALKYEKYWQTSAYKEKYISVKAIIEQYFKDYELKWGDGK